MTQQINNSNLLLSLAVFKKLYDDNKDIYSIISSFIKYELSDRRTPFTATDITQIVNEKYNFDIPQAIIQTSLKRIKKESYLKLEYGNYNVIKSIPIIKNDSESVKKQEKFVLDTIKEYLEDKETQYVNIEKSLENYILNKSDTLSTHINACIIFNTQNTDFIDALNRIKYGLVLYEGISYGIEDINPERWNKKTIFLDTEVLFYLAGYNGKLYKKIANDFLSLIEIINKKNKIINLKFLESVEKQIDNLFYVAELIITKKKRYQPNDVVKHILDCCQGGSASDILGQKTEFYKYLGEKGIKLYEDTIDYNDINIQKYNLESNDANDEKDQISLKQLSVINILRGNKVFNSLDKVSMLFITETKNTINFSIKHKKKNRDFPLALRLFDITNQLWIKTNKGLSNNNNLPATFDIRNKAKIALSADLQKTVCEEYEKISSNEDSISRNLVIDKLAELKELEMNPDDINEKNCEDLQAITINPKELEKHYEEKAFYKGESEEKSDIIQTKDETIKQLEVCNLRQRLEAKHKEKGIKISKKRGGLKIKRIFCYLSVVGILYLHRKQIYIWVNHSLFKVATVFATLITIYMFIVGNGK